MNDTLVFENNDNFSIEFIPESVWLFNFCIDTGKLELEINYECRDFAKDIQHTFVVAIEFDNDGVEIGMTVQHDYDTISLMFNSICDNIHKCLIFLVEYLERTDYRTYYKWSYEQKNYFKKMMGLEYDDDIIY